MSKVVLALASLLAFSPAVGQEAAPFCAVTGAGARCHYYNLQACQAVVGADGQCIVNPAAAPYSAAPTVRTPDVAGAFVYGAQAGQADRQGSQAWDAAAANLEATCRLCPSKPAYRVLYLCPSDSGQAFTSETPLIGCTVADIER